MKCTFYGGPYNKQEFDVQFGLDVVELLEPQKQSFRLGDDMPPFNRLTYERMYIAGRPRLAFILKGEHATAASR